MLVSLLDYGAGNVRSLRNAIAYLGYEVIEIQNPEDITNAQVIIFPGVGNFGQAIKSLQMKGFLKPLREYILANRPFFGICIGMQCLFSGSDESPEEEGLDIIHSRITKFQSSQPIRIPHIGWNGISSTNSDSLYKDIANDDSVYFVHSFCALPNELNIDWVLSTTDYSGIRFISSIQRGNIFATQFHPEKSGKVGLNIINEFLSRSGIILSDELIHRTLQSVEQLPSTFLVKRVIACLDVRNTDEGDLIVTKGDQYDVREESQSVGRFVSFLEIANINLTNYHRGLVRNLGKPVQLCQKYYEDGADEIVFLNITSFRQDVLEDLPMLQLLQQSSERAFVPLTVGGGIREYTDVHNHTFSALEVAARYFRAGADKVSIGSDAVYAVEEYLNTGMKSGKSSIEMISRHYGAQAVVVSIDPKRVYIQDPSQHEESLKNKTVIKLDEPGPNGEFYCWWQVTTKGGREFRNLDAVTFAKGCEDLGAGEIMLNCIDMDGQGQGYDHYLIQAVQKAVTLPIIASSGCGKQEHFSQVFKETDVSAALAAGIFHRNEVSIQQVKSHMRDQSIYYRSN